MVYGSFEVFKRTFGMSISRKQIGESVGSESAGGEGVPAGELYPRNHTDTCFHDGIRELAQRFPGLRSALVKAEKIFYSHQPTPDPGWMTERVDCEVTM